MPTPQLPVVGPSWIPLTSGSPRLLSVSVSMFLCLLSESMVLHGSLLPRCLFSYKNINHSGIASIFIANAIILALRLILPAKTLLADKLTVIGASGKHVHSSEKVTALLSHLVFCWHEVSGFLCPWPQGYSVLDVLLLNVVQTHPLPNSLSRPIDEASVIWHASKTQSR